MAGYDASNVALILSVSAPCPVPLLKLSSAHRQARTLGNLIIMFTQMERIRTAYTV